MILVVVFSLGFILLIRSQELSVYDQIKNHQQGTALWWVGHNGWIIKSNGLVIATDMLLDYPERINPPKITTDELSEILDISFVTHAHNDHFNRTVTKALVEKSNCLFVIPESCVEIAHELNIPEDRLQIAKPREPFHIKGISVTPLRAIHGNANFAIYYEANLQDCGYLLDVDGHTFLQPGDSYLLEDHLFLEDVDVLFFSPTEHNMYIDRSVILINTLNPDYIFPQHHSTIVVDERSRFWAKGYPDEVKLRLSDALKAKYHIMKQGQKMLIR